MNAYQPRTMPSFGYDCTCSSFQSIGMPIFVYDASANRFTALSFSWHDYAPFGQEIPAGVDGRSSLWGASDGISEKFTGKERDAESGLDYFGARYYGSALGRFTGPDEPLTDQNESDPQSWNLYGYVRNNPLRYTDSDGMECSYDPKTNNFTGDCNSPGDQNVTKANVPQVVTFTYSGPGPVAFAGAVGHHGLPGWRQIDPLSDAGRFFRDWNTGPLRAPWTNFYDYLHRQYNEAVGRAVREYLAKLGKSSLRSLSKEEAKELAKEILKSKEPGIRNFLNRLDRFNRGARKTLSDIIDDADAIMICIACSIRDAQESRGRMDKI